MYKGEILPGPIRIAAKLAILCVHRRGVDARAAGDPPFWFPLFGPSYLVPQFAAPPPRNNLQKVVIPCVHWRGVDARAAVDPPFRSPLFGPLFSVPPFWFPLFGSLYLVSSAPSSSSSISLAPSYCPGRRMVPRKWR